MLGWLPLAAVGGESAGLGEASGAGSLAAYAEDSEERFELGLRRPRASLGFDSTAGGGAFGRVAAVRFVLHVIAPDDSHRVAALEPHEVCDGVDDDGGEVADGVADLSDVPFDQILSTLSGRTAAGRRSASNANGMCSRPARPAPK